MNGYFTETGISKELGWTTASDEGQAAAPDGDRATAPDGGQATTPDEERTPNLSSYNHGDHDNKKASMELRSLDGSNDFNFKSSYNKRISYNLKAYTKTAG